MTHFSSMPSLADFSDVITTSTPSQISSDPTLGGRLELSRHGAISRVYAPFEPINKNARLVICGITPGRRQAIDALLEAHRQLKAGVDVTNAARAAKATASFAGAMRTNIAAMLDFIKLPEKFGIANSAAFFGTSSDLVHYTSTSRYPTFIGQRDYSGSSPTLRRLLQDQSQILDALSEEAAALPKAIWIPLGGKVADALQLLVDNGLIDASRVLSGLPHASGANAERIAYFLGRKSRDTLSSKTNSQIIDAGREKAVSIVAGIAA
jgi:hypothetical protein